MDEIDNRKYWLVAIFAFVGLGGAMIQARGALIPTFEGYFGVSKGQLGLVTPVGTVGFVAAMVWLGPASGRVDLRQFLLGGGILTAIALVLIGLAPTFTVLLAMVGVRSFGIGIFRALDRPTLSHLFPDSRARIFTLQEMAWAVGATTGPLLVTAVLLQFSWRLTYFVLAALTVPVLVVVWRLEPPAGTVNEKSFALSDMRSVLAHPSVYGMVAAIVLVGGIESAFFTWLPSYAGEMFSDGVASITLSIYLVSYIPGRLAFSRLGERYRFTDLLVGVTVVLTGLLYAAFVLADGPELLVLIFAIGFLVSGLYPTLISLGIESNPAYTGPVNAIANVATQVGFFTVPAAIGFLAEGSTIQQAMLVQIGLAGLLAIVLIGLRLGPVEDG
ncbi:MFS transporter [Halorhabdus sp. CBA1104]|uniref:MFS transporter n=1 Tax=Halorhabdus sp. CBA1104 TaxID=1380432 RepID=UPI0012B33B42|nr:MFS transporter [Halorhabdus sp. CBA1104]QGN06049.1 MFS transporter [Halorhabdus sp. CBA1104]